MNRQYIYPNNSMRLLRLHSDHLNWRLSMILFLCLVSKWQLQAQKIFTLEQCINQSLTHNSNYALSSILKNEADSKNKINALINLPKISLNGNATYQTAVTSLPISLPNIIVPSPQKDQYRITLDVQQNIYDGGLTHATKKMNAFTHSGDMAQWEVDNYSIREQVTALFFNIYVLTIPQKKADNLLTSMHQKLKKITSNVEEGVLGQADLLLIKSTVIEIQQQIKDLQHTKNSLNKALSIWMGEQLPDSLSLAMPENITISLDSKIQRPEQNSISARQKIVTGNLALIDAKYAPKVSIYATGGYGRPGLNFLSNQFDFYGIVGMNIKIPMEQMIFNSNHKEKELLRIQSEKLSVQLDAFEMRQQVQCAQKLEEIAKLENTITSDDSLISLKSSIRSIMEIRYEQGITTISDLTNAMQAETNARNNKTIHETQLTFAKIQFNLLKGIL